MTKPTYEDLEKRIAALKEEVSSLRQSREELRKSEERYSKLVENSLTGIYIDQDGRIVFANERFAEIYRYPRQEVIGMDSSSLVHPEDRPMIDEMRTKRIEGKGAPSEYEARGITKDGRAIWIKRRNTTIDHNGRPAILGNVVDITEKKNAEEALQKTHEEVKDLVQAIGHDLKSPVVAIRGLSKRLVNKHGEEMGEKAKEYVRRIATGAAQIEALVSDLRTLSQQGTVVPEFKNFSTRELVQKVLYPLRPRLKEKGVESAVSADLPLIRFDRDRLQQIFQNLLVNAVNYMGNPKKPRIEVGYEDKGDYHQFFVKDNGVGIDPEHHQEIFEKFRRLKRRGGVEGTGLGLAIVKNIVTGHGGKVWVESRKGRGATFYFTLPKEPEEPQGQV